MAGTARPAPTLTDDDVRRFWSLVDQRGTDECWPRRKPRASCYGRFRLSGQYWSCHTIALFLSTGEWPGGLVVCHRCDNPVCCNPAHLFAGTDRDNHRDALTKGRKKVPNPSHPGNRNAPTKLAAGQIAEVRSLHAAGRVTQRQLAERFGVSQSMVHKILTGKAWKHVREHIVA